MEICGKTSERIVLARRRAGYTQVQLAESLGRGWSQNKISFLETGRQDPNTSEIRALARVLGVSVSFLVGEQ